MPEPGRVKVFAYPGTGKSGKLDWMGLAGSKKKLISVFTKHLVSQSAFISYLREVDKYRQ